MFRDHYQDPQARLVDEAITWDEITGVDLHGFNGERFSVGQPRSGLAYVLWEK